MRLWSVGRLGTGSDADELAFRELSSLLGTRVAAAAAGEAALGVKLAPGAFERLAAYGRVVAHFPTAVKEFEWRNGWFYKLTCDAVKAGREDPMPLHTQALYDLKLPLPIAWIN